jgi:NADH-quinone oxidoreductase subunit F
MYETEIKSVRSKMDLDTIREEFIQHKKKFPWRALVCSGASCMSSDCQDVKEALEVALEKYELQSAVDVVVTGCMGACSTGPTLIIEPEDVFYCGLQPKDMDELVRIHFLEKTICREKTFFNLNTREYIPYLKDVPFFKGQEKIVLHNCGRIDFRSLEEYIANDGYLALHKALTQMSRDQVIQEISDAKLRGRGGGGFPTGLKWKLAGKNESDDKYVICNANEGDPGAFMDRSLLEGDPHGIIEGMVIGGYAIGANRGVVYVKAEYPKAIERTEEAIRRAREINLLGESIFGTDFSFDIEIRIGAGAFICGEETALIASVEGERGEPKLKPPYPSDAGLFNKPTVINNVETIGNVAAIILKGADWYSAFGTEESTGTKVFALAGNINNAGLVEVPMGTSLREILFDMGGGIPEGKKFKAALPGGPCGGCVTEEHLDVPMDFESLPELGATTGSGELICMDEDTCLVICATIGSGELICMDEDTCMVDVARYFMEIAQEESCGKCIPCRVGTRRMLEILERIAKGLGKEGDIELLVELGNVIKDSAFCGLGQTAPNPVLSTIKLFRDEYEEHIHDHCCRAGICPDLSGGPCENVESVAKPSDKEL